MGTPGEPGAWVRSRPLAPPLSPSSLITPLSLSLLPSCFYPSPYTDDPLPPLPCGPSARPIAALDACSLSTACASKEAASSASRLVSPSFSYYDPFEVYSAISRPCPCPSMVLVVFVIRLIPPYTSIPTSYISLCSPYLCLTTRTLPLSPIDPPSPSTRPSRMAACRSRRANSRD